jgi:hypothetical protein
VISDILDPILSTLSKDNGRFVSCLPVEITSSGFKFSGFIFKNLNN